MIRETVQNFTHPYKDSGGWNIGIENRSTIWFRKNCLMDIDSNLSFIDIKGCNDLNILWFVPSNFMMHQADHVLRIFIPVIVNSLNQGAGTVSNTNQGDFYFFDTLSIRQKCP